MQANKIGEVILIKFLTKYSRKGFSSVAHHEPQKLSVAREDGVAAEPTIADKFHGSADRGGG